MKVKTMKLMETPLITNLALYLFTVPSTFSLIRNTHLHPIAFLFGGRGTRDRVLFFWRAVYSACIVASQLGSFRACFVVLGSIVVRKTEG